MVTIWVEQRPLHVIVELLIWLLSPQHSSVPLIGMRLLTEIYLVHIKVVGNLIVIKPSEGIQLPAVKLIIISFVLFTTPPMNVILRPLIGAGVKLTDASAELLEINASVVRAEGGFIIFYNTKSTQLTKSVPLNKLVMVMVLPERLQIKFTITLQQKNPLSWEGANCDGNVMVVLAVAGVLDAFQLVGLRESSQFLRREMVQVVRILI